MPTRVAVKSLVGARHSSGAGARWGRVTPVTRHLWRVAKTRDWSRAPPAKPVCHWKGALPAALVALALHAGVAVPAVAQGCGDARATSVVGLDAVDGDTFRTIDGHEWRLAGVMAPKRSDGARAPRSADEPGDRDSGRPRGSPADAARAALDALVARQTLWLAEVSETADRYERRLAVARDATCGSLAGRLLAAGHLRVYPTFATRALAPDLHEAEAGARTVSRGLWADVRYRVLPAAEVGGRFDSYVVVEDRPVSAHDTRAGTVLVFGPEMRRDFGVTIAPKVRKLMRAAGRDPASLVGRQVRVRGWLRNRGGAPVIELAVPEQLEVVER